MFLNICIYHYLKGPCTLKYAFQVQWLLLTGVLVKIQISAVSLNLP